MGSAIELWRELARRPPDKRLVAEPILRIGADRRSVAEASLRQLSVLRLCCLANGCIVGDSTCGAAASQVAVVELAITPSAARAVSSMAQLRWVGAGGDVGHEGLMSQQCLLAQQVGDDGLSCRQVREGEVAGD